MSQISTAMHSSGQPAVISQALDQTVRRLHSAVEVTGGRHCSISSQSAPTEAERRALTGRKRDLDAGLFGTAPDRITTLIGTLLIAFPSRNMERKEREAALKLYVSALATYPEWAITEACRRFNSGKAGKPEYAPTPAQVAVECEDIVSDARGERYRITQILDAEVYVERDPAMRERMLERFDELKADLLKTSGPRSEAAAWKPAPLDSDEAVAAAHAAFREAAANSVMFAPKPAEGAADE